MKVSKEDYEKCIKYTEITIIALFALSAVLMSMSQDKLMKSTEIILKNIENFEVALLGQQNAVQNSINHLISCNGLDLTKYIKEVPTSEFLEVVEQVKEDCVSDSLKRAVNASDVAGELINISIKYKNITNNDFENYKSQSQNLSKMAFWVFLAGVFLCFCLILDLIIFKPKRD